MMTNGMVMFITSLLEGDLSGVKYWALAIGLMALMVIVAALIDLRWGIRASKACGEFKTTSYGLRNTVVKLESYMVFFFLSVMIDACLSFFVPFPVASVIVAVSEILIEGVSVYENKKRTKSGHADPINVAKAVAKTFGISDAAKIERIIKAVKAEQQKEEREERKEEKKPARRKTGGKGKAAASGKGGTRAAQAPGDIAPP